MDDGAAPISGCFEEIETVSYATDAYSSHDAGFYRNSGFHQTRDGTSTDEELAKVQNQLLENPEAGDVIVGGGGLRKLRVRLKGSGKRGGARLIYYRITDRQQIFLLIYAKNEAEDLTSEQKRVLRALVEAEVSLEKKS